MWDTHIQEKAWFGASVVSWKCMCLPKVKKVVSFINTKVILKTEIFRHHQETAYKMSNDWLA